MDAYTGTTEEVCAHLWEQHNRLRDAGLPSPPVSNFFHGDVDLQNYRLAMQWWPQHTHHPTMPKQLMAPDLYSLCHQYQDERFGTTFIQRLHQATTPVVAWLQANNISVDRPNETRDEKRARQNRDAQRRFRERQSGQGDPAVQAAYDQWQSEIAERKRVMAELDLLVKDAQENFMKTCDQRRHMKETLDNCVARAKADYDALKNNPQPEG